MHSDCPLGISQLVEIKDPSYKMRMSRSENTNRTRYIVSSTFDKNDFKIWTLSFNEKFNNRPEFTLHSKITSTLEGISFML
jgi:hypothetical protein